MTGLPGQAPGVVKLRICGAAADITTLASLLDTLAAVEILDQSASYADRRDPGERVYLTVRLATGGGR